MMSPNWLTRFRSSLNWGPLKMTEDEKAQVAKYYDQKKLAKQLEQAATFNNQLGQSILGSLQAAPWRSNTTGQAAPWRSSTTGGVIPGGYGSNVTTSNTPTTVVPSRDMRVQYLEDLTEVLMQQIATEQNRNATANLKVAEMQRDHAVYLSMVEFLKNNYPEALVEFDNTQTVLKRMTT